MIEKDIFRALYVQIPDDLDRRLRQYCLDRRMTLTEAVTAALEAYITEKRPCQQEIELNRELSRE